MLAQIHELIQQQTRLLGAAHFTDRKHRKNPVPEPHKVPRPWVHEDEEEDLKDPTEDIPDGFWDEEEDDDPEDEEEE